MLVELADEELCLLPATIDITVVVAADSDSEGSLVERAEWRPSGAGRKWRLPLTATDVSERAERIGSELLAALSITLIDASLLPATTFTQAIERAFERGLAHKLVFGLPYDDLRTKFEDSGLRNGISTDCRRSDAPASEPDETEELTWRSTPGPGFSSEDATGNARARYEKIAQRLPRQLGMLRDDPDFSSVVAELRGRGWLDHHVLASVMTIVINYRARAEGIDLRNSDKAEGVIETPEGERTDLVPSSEFDTKAMEEARRFNLPAVLRTWGLTLNSPTPDLDAVEKVLAERYSYWTADSPHDEDLLPRARDEEGRRR